MGRSCTICESEARQAIEEAMEDGESYRSLGERYGTSKSALARHREAHMGAEVEKLKEEARERQVEAGKSFGRGKVPQLIGEPIEPPGCEKERTFFDIITGKYRVFKPQAEEEQPGQAPPPPMVNKEKEPRKPLSPAGQEWNKFVDKLEDLEAKAREQEPRLREAISRLYDEMGVGRQKVEELVVREAELTQKLVKLQSEQLIRIERGEVGNMADDLARAGEELAMVRQALEAEKVRFEEMEGQVKARISGLHAQIWSLKAAPAEFMGKTWKTWWWKLGEAEEAVKGQVVNLREQTSYSAGPTSVAIRGFADMVEGWEIELKRATAERDLLRELVEYLGKLLVKEPPYRDALIQARVLDVSFTWPPKITQHERYGLDGSRVRDRLINDPRWATA